MSEAVEVCELHEINDPGAREFAVRTRSGDIWYGFLVRKGNEVFGYANACPHTGAMLNWGPDRFLTSAGNQIMCGVHGALFEIESGFCTSGPCKGQSLREITVWQEAGKVFINRPA